MNSARPYRMRARAEAAEDTRRRVFDAAAGLLRQRLRADIRLEDVATGAGVTVQTVLRVAGSKAELFRVAFEHILAEIAGQLQGAEPGDVDAAVRTWFDHYEQFGDVVVRTLADETDPAVGPIVEVGRAKHRQRVDHVLGPLLANRAADERARVLDALVCASDVYTWKLLRRDFGRSRADAEAAMRLMIESIAGSRR
ncbi:TetR/AcrR family transcriptional regulator [Amycolatopsis silviterrae]|uniref:TetR/AcrR family transcriptional regulator n=1 Tax=Amycolatopsis silviterrae TaxID=1656914 RepID=A0ABW5H3L2_9PSEU